MTRARAIELLKGVRFCCDLDDCTNAWDCEECDDALEMAIEALEQEPKRGKWLNYLKEGLKWKCPECGSKYTTPWHYCPNCGARMETEQ